MLDTFLLASGLPHEVPLIERAHIEAFIVDVLATQSPATASNRYRALQSFFRWAEEEDEVERNPMAKMKPPTVPVAPVPVIRDDELDALFKACQGTDFADYRDAAIIRLLLDTGMRRAELGAIEVDDLDLRRKSVRVVGKGRKVRDCVFGANTARALDRYLRKARPRHRDAASPALWLGHAGPMTDNGIYQAILERAKRAGLEGIHPHQFRHTWAHKLSADGMPESQLMHLAGWSSTQMASRYGASAVGERRACHLPADEPRRQALGPAGTGPAVGCAAGSPARERRARVLAEAGTSSVDSWRSTRLVGLSWFSARSSGSSGPASLRTRSMLPVALTRPQARRRSSTASSAR